MFLAIDENFNNDYITLGCLVLPEKELVDLEKKFIEHRLNHKLWGEIKWSKISPNWIIQYEEFIKIFLENKHVTFHSWTYRKPTGIERKRYFNGTNKEKIIYRHAYLLIRSIIWKCKKNMMNNGDYYILADESGKLGSEEYKMTQNFLIDDKRITKPLNINFCNTGNSTSCGTLQACDLLTGATSTYYRKEPINNLQKKIIKYIEGFNNNVPLNYSHPTLPNLYDFKIHHCKVTF